MKFAMICILLSISFNCYTQVQIKILDRKSEPIPWVTVVWNNNSGLVTDELGLVTIPSKNDIIDSILVSNIGYLGISISKEKLSDKSINVLALE